MKDLLPEDTYFDGKIAIPFYKVCGIDVLAARPAFVYYALMGGYTNAFARHEQMADRDSLSDLWLANYAYAFSRTGRAKDGRIIEYQSNNFNLEISYI